MYLERKHYERVGLWRTGKAIAVAVALVERRTWSPVICTRIFRITFNLKRVRRQVIDIKTFKIH